MGILRVDRVAGLGGANAIKGSVYFPYVTSGGYFHQYQQIQSDDYAFGTGAFTLECWYYMDGDGGHTDSVGNIILLTGTNSLASTSNNGVWLASRNDNKFEARVYYVSGSWNMTMTSTNAFARQTWHHLAMVRSGSAVKLYVNGVEEASGSSSSDLDTTVSTSLYIGAQGNATTVGSLGSRGITGYVSNVRVSNEALYTAAFTPPVGELQKLSSTITLCNQSPSDVLKEETGKTITLYRKTLNHQLPLATKFTPNSPVGFSTTTDVGTQFGSTFDGVTTFDSQAYMVVPGGNTRERNRGRGLWGGGWNSPSNTSTNNIDFIQIQSGGIAKDFGDLIAGGNQMRGVSSSTRGVFLGGRRPHPGVVNTMDFITIATTANALDFGDLLTGRGAVGEISSQTRGIAAAGYNPGNTNVIEFITIATLGNSQDFGDTLSAGSAMAGTQSSTRGILAGNYAPSSPNTSNVIQFLTIATTGNTQDFGDLTDSRHSPSGTSNGIRAVFAAGTHLSPGNNNTMDFVTIASTGNATDFGDLLTVSTGHLGATSDKIRGVFGGGSNSPLYHDNIQQVIISTTGNSVDIGDLTLARLQSGCVSDSHGGLE